VWEKQTPKQALSIETSSEAGVATSSGRGGLLSPASPALSKSHSTRRQVAPASPTAKATAARKQWKTAASRSKAVVAFSSLTKPGSPGEEQPRLKTAPKAGGGRKRQPSAARAVTAGAASESAGTLMEWDREGAEGGSGAEHEAEVIGTAGDEATAAAAADYNLFHRSTGSPSGGSKGSTIGPEGRKTSATKSSLRRRLSSNSASSKDHGPVAIGDRGRVLQPAVPSIREGSPTGSRTSAAEPLTAGDSFEDTGQLGLPPISSRPSSASRPLSSRNPEASVAGPAGSQGPPGAGGSERPSSRQSTRSSGTGDGSTMAPPHSARRLLSPRSSHFSTAPTEDPTQRMPPIPAQPSNGTRGAEGTPPPPEASNPMIPIVWESPDDVAKQLAAKILKSALPLPKVYSLSAQPSQVGIAGEEQGNAEQVEVGLPAEQAGGGSTKWWAQGGAKHQPPVELRRKVVLEATALKQDTMSNIPSNRSQASASSTDREQSITGAAASSQKSDLKGQQQKPSTAGSSLSGWETAAGGEASAAHLEGELTISSSEEESIEDGSGSETSSGFEY